MGEDDLGRTAFAQMLFDQMPQMMQIDDDLFNRVVLQSVDGAVDHGAPADLDQGLGKFFGQRPHTGSETGGQDHGAFWHLDIGSAYRFEFGLVGHVSPPGRRSGTR